MSLLPGIRRPDGDLPIRVRVERDQTTEENRVTNAGILDNTQNQVITGVNYRRLLDINVMLQFGGKTFAF